MNVFLYRTLIFYVLSQAYLFWSFYRLSGKKRAVLLSLPWFLAMGLFPLIHLHLPPGSAAQQAFSFLGTVWLPTAFFCLLVFACRDAFSLLHRLLRKLAPNLRLPAPGRGADRAILLLCACIFAYGLYEARTLTVTGLQIATDKLPGDMERFRVVFVSDQHIGPQTGRAMLRKTVDRILAQQPDCILLGGDTFDDALQGTPDDAAELARLRAPAGVYAVLGNHDAFGPHEHSAAVLREAGITVLSGQKVAAGPVTVIGLDDPRVLEQKNDAGPEIISLLRGAPPERFTILLDHRPVIRPESVGLIDLQLSGHSHGGQILPLKPYMHLSYGAPNGLSSHTSLKGQSLLFITTGVGFSKLPIRLLVPPEIVVIDLVRERL